MKRLFGASILGALLITCSLYLIPYFQIENGQVFTPINSQHYSCGDYRFYFSGVQKAIHNISTYQNSTGSVGEGTLIDKSRITLYRLGALLTFFVKDARLGFVLTSFFALMLTLLFLSKLLRKITPSTFVAFGFAVVFIFYLEVFRGFMTFDLGTLSSLFTETAIDGTRALFPQRMNDNFRFLVLSHANLFIVVAFILSVALLRAKVSLSLLISTGLFTIVLLYTYLPVIIYSAILVGGALLLRFPEYPKRILFFTILLLGGLGIFGIFSDLLEIYSKIPAAIADAHLKKPELFQISNLLANLDIVKSLALLVGMTLSAYALKMNLRRLYLILTIGIFLQCLAIFEGHGHILTRFFIRGGLSFVFIAFLIFILELMKRFKLHRWRTMVRLTVIVVCVLPVVNLFRVSQSMAESQSYALDTYQWEALDWLSRNTTGDSSILALNVSDIQLLPNYTKANLTIAGAEYLREPIDELKRYVYFSKLIGSKADVVLDLKEYFAKRDQFSCQPLGAEGNFAQFEKVHFYDQLLYYPFISKLGEVPYLKNGVINSEIVPLLAKLENSHEAVKLPDFILLTGNESKLDKTSEFNREYIIAFTNEDRSVYKRK